MTETLAYTAEELGPLLQVTPAHIRKLGRAGAIPALKLGRRIVFPKAAIHRWLDEQANQSKAAS